MGKEKGALLERRTKRSPVAGGEEAGMGFVFRGCDEGREGASFARCNPSARGAVRTEGSFDLLRVARELESEEGIDLGFGEEVLGIFGVWIKEKDAGHTLRSTSSTVLESLKNSQ